MTSPTFLGFHDPDRKRTPAQKLANACERYTLKFGLKADVALVSPREALALGSEPVDGVTIEGRSYIAPDIFYVGRQGDPPAKREISEVRS